MEVGEICHQGDLSEVGLVVMGPSSQLCAQNMHLGRDLGESFHFSDSGEEKKNHKHLPASNEGIISSYQCHVDLS